MTLVSIILVLALEQWRPLAERQALAGALHRYAAFLAKHFNAGERQHGVIAWLLAVLPLAWQRLRVRDATFATVLIQVHPRPNEPSTWKPHFLPALMTIQSDALRVGRLRIVAPSGQEVDFDDVRLFDLDQIQAAYELSLGARHPEGIAVRVGPLSTREVPRRA